MPTGLDLSLLLQLLRLADRFLPPLWGKVRKRGCHGLSSAVDPLSLALFHEGRGSPYPNPYSLL
jgi:hypothetical protein